MLQLVARDIAFDESELAASAGPLTITMVNEDEGIPHNLHVFRGSDATGEDVGATEIEAGPVTQWLSLDLSPGTYFFRCDVHPTQMSGTLMVQ